MGNTIEGKVAKIIDETTVVINRGSVAGVKDNMKFAVVAEGDEVTDPDSGISLGAWDVVKGYVRATHVQERLSVCTAFDPASDQERTSKTLSAAMVDVSFPTPGAGASLPVQSSDVSGRPSVGPVRVGDIVKSIDS